jgi:hypothetical protein
MYWFLIILSLILLFFIGMFILQTYLNHPEKFSFEFLLSSVVDAVKKFISLPPQVLFPSLRIVGLIVCIAIWLNVKDETVRRYALICGALALYSLFISLACITTINKLNAQTMDDNPSVDPERPFLTFLLTSINLLGRTLLYALIVLVLFILFGFICEVRVKHHLEPYTLEKAMSDYKKSTIVGTLASSPIIAWRLLFVFGSYVTSSLADVKELLDGLLQSLQSKSLRYHGYSVLIYGAVVAAVGLYLQYKKPTSPAAYSKALLLTTGTLGFTYGGCLFLLA